MNNSPYFKNHDPTSDKELAPNVGCIVSNRVSIEGKPIRYMAKEEGIDPTDSSWAFYAGDEDEAYTNNSKNFQLFSLNTIANIDPSIIPFLDSPTGTAFEKVPLKEQWRRVED